VRDRKIESGKGKSGRGPAQDAVGLSELRRIDRRGILSAKGAERGGAPHFAKSVRNCGLFFSREPQDAGLEARRYKETQELPFARSGWRTEEAGPLLRPGYGWWCYLGRFFCGDCGWCWRESWRRVRVGKGSLRKAGAIRAVFFVGCVSQEAPRRALGAEARD
jgi:hypothetical protein